MSAPAPTTPDLICLIRRPFSLPAKKNTGMATNAYTGKNMIPMLKIPAGNGDEDHGSQRIPLPDPADDGRHKDQKDVDPGDLFQCGGRVRPTLQLVPEKPQRRLLNSGHAPAVHAPLAGLDEYPLPPRLQAVAPRFPLHDPPRGRGSGEGGPRRGEIRQDGWPPGDLQIAPHTKPSGEGRQDA